MRKYENKLSELKQFLQTAMPSDLIRLNSRICHLIGMLDRIPVSTVLEGQISILKSRIACNIDQLVEREKPQVAQFNLETS